VQRFVGGFGCTLRSICGNFGFASLNLSLVSQVFRPVGLFLHSIRKIFGSISLIFHPVSEILHPIRLFPRRHSEIVGVGSALMHFPPLSADKYSRETRHEDGSFGPSQSRFLKSAHLLFDFCELLCGGWACCWGVNRLGCIGWRQTSIGLFVILFGWGLIVHGGLQLIFAT